MDRHGLDVVVQPAEQKEVDLVDACSEIGDRIDIGGVNDATHFDCFERGSEIEGVDLRAAKQSVISQTAIKAVLADIAVEGIVARVTCLGVIADAAVNGVVALAANEDIVVAAAVERERLNAVIG